MRKERVANQTRRARGESSIKILYKRVYLAKFSRALCTALYCIMMVTMKVWVFGSKKS